MPIANLSLRLRCTTWNCAAFFHRSHKIKMARLHYLRKLLSVSDVCLLQETHGSKENFAHLIKNHFREFEVHATSVRTRPRRSSFDAELSKTTPRSFTAIRSPGALLAVP